MPPQSIDVTTLEDLKRQAIGRAEALGHRLQPFRTTKHDPLCYVSFCDGCRQMVIVSLEHVPSSDHAGTLYGYALEARCAAHTVEHAEAVAASHGR